MNITHDKDFYPLKIGFITMSAQFQEPPKIKIWIKDSNNKYTYCNQLFAMGLGLDSPGQIVGKSDYELSWKDVQKIEYFRLIDFKVFSGEISYVNIYEEAITTTGTVMGLVTKSQLHNNEGKCIGTMGCSQPLINPLPYSQYSNDCNKPILTWKELQILKGVLQGYSAKVIGQKLNISSRTVETHVNNIKLKFQCNTKGDIVHTAIKLGFVGAMHFLI